MKLFHELFPGVKPDEITDILKKYNLAIPDGFRFSQTNLIIGPNGAGKTRFLNALRELYKKTKNTSLLYGYFPDLMSRRPPKPSGRKLRKHTLQQYRDMDGVSFEDFFQEVEAQNEKFFLRVLEPESESEDIANSQTMALVAEFFKALTGKSIYSISEDEGEPGGRMVLMVGNPGARPLPLEEALEEISPGERMLFYMAIFLALQKKGRKNEVIILDEPESHLHPKALLQFIHLLSKNFSHASVWIATHSLFLLPEYEFENIVYLENGEVHKRNSKLYQDVITDVLGEGRENVRQFFASYPQWQYNDFIAGCFDKPEVVDDINPEDQQIVAFRGLLESNSIQQILDFGGGSGRLGLSMLASKIPKWENVIYEIFDPDPVYEGDEFKVYTKLEDCRSDYDCVVMMNVLHEIDPREWAALFQKIAERMTPDGFLLFVEVAALKKGEYPNDVGYMVLSDLELDIIFCDEAHMAQAMKERYKEITSCFLYTRDQLKKATTETVHAAIEHLEKRMYQEILQIRKAEKERRKKESSGEKLSPGELSSQGANARRYAFLTQQYINAKLFNDSTADLSLPNMTVPDRLL